MDKKAEGERENLPNQEALEQLEQLVQKFKLLRSQMVNSVYLKGDKGFTIRSAENQYGKLYADTIVLLTRYLPECVKNDAEGFVAIVQREVTAELHQKGNLSVDIARFILSPLAKLEKLAAQIDACTSTLELYKQKYFTKKSYDESQLGIRRDEMKLTGSQYQQLTDALLDAFPTPAKLAEMVQFRIEKNLHAIATGDDLREVIVKLIGTAQAQGWITRLIVAARESNPGNPALLAFSQQLGLAPGPSHQPELERIIKATNSFLDVDKWRTKLGQIETQVCRIEIQSNKGMIYGTGFLLAPDVVITNYHVMEAVIEGEHGRTTNRGASAMPSDVALRFDYKRLADGVTLNPGTVYRLALEKWLIDKSPMSPVDNVAEPKYSLPEPDQLDYALLRVDGSPGNDSVGNKAEHVGLPRKWIEVPIPVPNIYPNTALFIVQHPQGDPLQLALETDAIIGVNANNTRVSYKTNTLRGSSGSPCFNSNWELIALHHSGDPNFDPAHKPLYNEGIPFSAIVNLLTQRGLGRIFTEQNL